VEIVGPAEVGVGVGDAKIQDRRLAPPAYRNEQRLAELQHDLVRLQTLQAGETLQQLRLRRVANAAVDVVVVVQARRFVRRPRSGGSLIPSGENLQRADGSP
jgi:hypothetical protein